MRIPVYHLHTPVPGNGCNLLIRKALLDKTADCLVTQIMEMHVGQLQFALDIQPYRIELVGAAFAVAPRFAVKEQVGVDGAHGVIQSLTEYCRRRCTEWHGARQCVFGFEETYDPALEVHLRSA